MRRTTTGAALALLAMAAGACGGGSGSTSLTGPITSTTVLPSTSVLTTAAISTTTATTLPPTTTTTLSPPAVIWGDPASLVVVPPSHVVSQVGDLSGTDLTLVTSWNSSAYLFVETQRFGRTHDLGMVQQTDSYSDIAVWASPDAVEWSEYPGLVIPGDFDEWAYGAAPFGNSLIVVGAWREAGTDPVQVQGFWTFPTDDKDGFVWVGSGSPPVWSQAVHADLSGDREEVMHAVVVVGGALVAVGTSDVLPQFGSGARPENAGAIWISEDGLVWERVPDGSGLFSGPGISTGLQAAVSSGTTAWAFGVETRSGSALLAVWSTGNGTDWVRIEIPDDAVSSSRGLLVADAALATPGIVVVGNEFGDDGRSPAAWFSPDGASWERIDLGIQEEGELRSVAATEFGFVAVGRYLDPQGGHRPLLLLSGDGRTWTRDPGLAFDLGNGTRRLGLVAVGVHRGVVIVGGLAVYFDDSEELLVWSGPIGPSGG